MPTSGLFWHSVKQNDLHDKDYEIRYSEVPLLPCFRREFANRLGFFNILFDGFIINGGKSCRNFTLLVHIIAGHLFQKYFDVKFINVYSLYWPCLRKVVKILFPFRNAHPAVWKTDIHKFLPAITLIEI